MGSLFSALDIARSGMSVSRVQMDTAAHNIANAETEGYSRQRVKVDTFSPIRFSYGNLGRGAQVTDIRRVRDTFLDVTYRQQVGALGTAEVQSRYYKGIEDAFLEPSDSGLGVRLNVFFDAMNEFANNVESYSVREIAVAESISMAETINDLYSRVDKLRTNANDEIKSLVPEINALTESIAEMNRLIQKTELGNKSANDLRDSRDRTLDELAKLVNINTTEMADGQITVRIGSEVLVDQAGARQLEYVANPGMDERRGDLLEVRFTDTNRTVELRDGELFAALEMRDTVIPSFMDRIDTLTASLIEQINRIHSQANGLVNQTGIISSTNPVSNTGEVLEDAGLPFGIEDGSFRILVYDADGNQVGDEEILVNPATDSLDDIVAALNGVGEISAVINPDGETFSIEVSGGHSFAFADDTSGVLTALGINGLFTGYDAQTIAVNPDIIEDPGLLASGFTPDPEEVGDNRAALAMADVRSKMVLDNDSSTINDFYESTVAKLGVEARNNRVKLETETTFTQDYNQRRQRISGVSIDEEVTFMMAYQRAFEGSARVVTTVDRMLDALFNMAL